jgi:Protein of unknown function (DUF2794)
MDDLSEAQRPGGAAEIISLPHRPQHMPVMFDRRELDKILQIYARMVGTGEWRDYAIDSFGDHATFSIYRRHSEHPLYRVEKNPKLARKQGAFSVVSANGVVLKRGHDLASVLAVFNRSLKLIDN